MIYWKVNTTNKDVASVRYRAIIPAYSIESLGCRSKIIEKLDASVLRNDDVVVFVKAFNIDGLRSVNESAFMTNNIYYDLCDNVFVDNYVSGDNVPASAIVKEISKKCLGFVTTGTKLQEVIQQNTDKAVPVYVVPDAVESQTVIDSVEVNDQPRSHYFMLQLARKLDRKLRFRNKIQNLKKHRLLRGFRFVERFRHLGWYGRLTRVFARLAKRVKSLKGYLAIARNRLSLNHLRKLSGQLVKRMTTLAKRAKRLRGYLIMARNRLSPAYIRKKLRIRKQYRQFRKRLATLVKRVRGLKGYLVMARNRLSPLYLRKRLRVRRWYRKFGKQMATLIKRAKSRKGYLRMVGNRLTPYYIYKFSRRRLGSLFGVLRGNASLSSAVQSADRGEPRRILWFGNYGAEHTKFGMSDILIVSSALEELSKRYNLVLLVVSNNRDRYRRLIEPLPFASKYYEWTRRGMESLFKMSDVAIVPNNLDEFSICKSANRALLALNHGVPVVATRTPALEPLSECIALDDWVNGIEEYLRDKDKCSRDVAKAKRIIENDYSIDRVGREWQRLVSQALPDHRKMAGAHGCEKNSNENIVALSLQLLTDLDSLIPILKSNTGFRKEVLVHDKLLIKYPECITKLPMLNATYWILSEEFISKNSARICARYSALLCPTESNLGPHSFARTLASMMNEAGRPTYTMQHGHENIGLTYSDAIHDVASIEFASRKVFIWGRVDALLEEVREETRAKCVPVGLVKPRVGKNGKYLAEFLGERYQCVVGIFENLHWHRYSKRYISDFVEALDILCESFVDVLFVVKPHPAGKWITDRYLGPTPGKDNIVILSDGVMDGKISLEQYLCEFSAIITTPSTIAIDAALNRLPIALLEYDLSLDRYDHLYKAKDNSDLVKFVQTVADGGGGQFATNAERFLSKYVVSKDAAPEICAIIDKDLAG